MSLKADSRSGGVKVQVTERWPEGRVHSPIEMLAAFRLVCCRCVRDVSELGRGLHLIRRYGEWQRAHLRDIESGKVSLGSKSKSNNILGCASSPVRYRWAVRTSPTTEATGRVRGPRHRRAVSAPSEGHGSARGERPDVIARAPGPTLRTHVGNHGSRRCLNRHGASGGQGLHSRG